MPDYPKPDSDTGSKPAIVEFIDKHHLEMEATLGVLPADWEGGDKQSAKWNCVIREVASGRAMETSYTMGSAYRVWKKNATTLIQREIAQRARGERATSPGGATIHFMENTEPMRPTLAAVLEALVTDAASFDDAIDYEDWASNFGYDPDSRHGEKIYNACGEQSRGLRRLLGAYAHGELMALYRNGDLS